METLVIWGCLLTAQMPGMPPIIDPNYKTVQECEVVKAEFVSAHPNYDAACTPTFKPYAAPKAKRRMATRKPTYRRTTRR
jgi:hypothetical protein